jgi:hypothetical protein
MPESFAQALEPWHDFYALLGSTAAALLGLLFVAVSLHLDSLTAAVQGLAYETFNHFITLLLIAFLCLIPALPPSWFGVGLLLLGLGGAVRLAWRRRAEPAQERLGLPTPRRRDVLPALAYLLLVGLGLWYLAGQTGLLGVLVAVDFLLLIQATWRAWEMLLYLGARKTPGSAE